MCQEHTSLHSRAYILAGKADKQLPKAMCGLREELGKDFPSGEGLSLMALAIPNSYHSSW